MERRSAANLLTVAIIVERDAAGRIRELADHVHVWAVDTAENRRVAEEVWARRAGTEPELSMTVFHFEEGPSDRIVANVLDTIDMHHDESSQPVAWSQAIVFGAPATPSLVDDLRDLGFEEITPTNTGFTACRRKRECG